MEAQAFALVLVEFLDSQLSRNPFVERDQRVVLLKDEKPID
jgi:hypothetical protein